jgi:histone-lysine N-methyltransferase SETMAR
VLLLQDNAPVHTVAIAKGAVRDCDFTEINHLPYSPDMAPCDYFLFPVFKKDLRGRKFKSDDELQSGVLEHFRGNLHNIFLRVYNC